MNNLLEHAKRELVAAGYGPNETEEGPDKWMRANLLELIKVFAGQGHSGMSAPYCIDAFCKLAKFEPLVPLTGEDNEWEEVGHGLWQNKRCSRVFKAENGDPYDIEGKVFCQPDGASYINKDSRVPVTFPYTPKSEYVES